MGDSDDNDYNLNNIDGNCDDCSGVIVSIPSRLCQTTHSSLLGDSDDDDYNLNDNDGNYDDCSGVMVSICEDDDLVF